MIFAELKCAPVSLVELHLLFYCLQIFLLHIAQIALIAQHAKCRHSESRLKRGDSECLVIRASGHVTAEYRHRVAIAVTRLYLKPLPGIRVITRPYLRHIAQYAEIKSVATGSTSLKQNLRETLSNPSHDIVESQHIPVSKFALPVRRQRLAVPVRHDPVHIPLHVRDIRR